MSKIIADPIDFKEYKKTTDSAKDFLLPADAYLDDLFDLMKIQDNSGIKLPWQKYQEDFSKIQTNLPAIGILKPSGDFSTLWKCILVDPMRHWPRYSFGIWITLVQGSRP